MTDKWFMWIFDAVGQKSIHDYDDGANEIPTWHYGSTASLLQRFCSLLLHHVPPRNGKTSRPSHGILGSSNSWYIVKGRSSL